VLAGAQLGQQDGHQPPEALAVPKGVWNVAGQRQLAGDTLASVFLWAGGGSVQPCLLTPR
jgi:hypothetical protein